MKVENKFWAMMSIFAVVLTVVTLMLTSCASSKSCHTKGIYVDKSVKKAQSKRSAH
jgi:hypothetical protein